MYARTTICLEQADLQLLPNIIKQENEKSLFFFINKLIKEYLEQRQKKLVLTKMVENYKKYAKNVDKKAFHAVEEIALEDLI
jgi:predicted transcriptional regulator